MFCYVVVPFPPHLEIFSCLRPHKDLRIPPGSHTTRAHHPSHVNFPTLSLVYIRNRYPISSTPLPFIFPISPPIKLNPFLSLSLSHTLLRFSMFINTSLKDTQNHTLTHTQTSHYLTKKAHRITQTRTKLHTQKRLTNLHIYAKSLKRNPGSR